MFENIVITRSFINEARLGSLNHVQQGIYIRGPLNPEKFSRILKCEPGLSEEAWNTYMGTFQDRAVEEQPVGPSQDAKSAEDT